MKNKWIEIKETGQLYLEQVLVSFEIPILFVCKDFANYRYLCECVDEEIGQFVITSINNEMLLQMLLNEKTMEEVFRDSSEKMIITEYDFQNSKMNSRKELAKDIPEDYLPKRGEFFEIESKEIMKYVEMLREQIGAISFGERYEIDNLQINNYPLFEKIEIDDFVTIESLESMKLEINNKFIIDENNGFVGIAA